MPSSESVVLPVSLRDYFAAHALNAILLSTNPGFYGDADKLARYAYNHADAMLTARNATQSIRESDG